MQIGLLTTVLRKYFNPDKRLYSNLKYLTALFVYGLSY